MNNINNDNIKVPEGWKRVRLGEVVKYEQPTKYLVKNENYDKNSGIPVLTPGKTFILGYTEEKFGIFENLPVIIFDDFTTESKYINFPFKLKSSAIKILNTKNEESNLYVAYYILQILNFKPGSEHKRFWISEFSKLQILLPPLPEQQKIAEILETVDRAIEKTDKIIEKYKLIKQGLMQDLLTKGIDENGKIRSEKTHKFKNSPLGRIPEEWEVVRLGNIVKEVIDNRGKTPPISDEGIELIETSAISNTIRYPNYEKIEKFVSIKTYNSWFRNYSKKNDILISTVGEYAGVSALMFENRGEIAQNLIGLRLKSDNSEFIFYFTRSDFYITQLKKVMMNQAQPSLKVPWLLDFQIPLPPLSEQQRIAEILSQIDNVIEKEGAYKQKLEHIKKGLMEDLLTGRVRVNKLIKEVKKEKK